METPDEVNNALDTVQNVTRRILFWFLYNRSYRKNDYNSLNCYIIATKLVLERFGV